MLKISDILMYVYRGVKAKDTRFTVVDDEHICDTKTGVKYHLYDDTTKITYGDKTIIKQVHFTPEEQTILFELKKLITDPETVAKKTAEYPKVLHQARQSFSDLYETPSPMPAKVAPTAEVDAKPYTG